jgi:hypothetical protein
MGETMKTFLISLIFVIAIISIYAETIIPAGNISGSWNAAGSPYFIIGNVVISAQDELVINPGVEVIFNGTFQMQVLGKIYCNGTEDDIITFTAQDTLNGWASIRFNNNASLAGNPSSFTYTHFMYGKAVNGPTSQDPLNFGGAVWASNAGTLSFNNCVFSNCKSTQDGSAIYAKDNSNLVMQNCSIKNCDSGFFGGVFVKNSTALIQNCTFKNNHAQTFGAALYFYQCTSSAVVSCTFSSSTAGAVAGVYSFDSPLVVQNSLFTGNATTFGLGGGIGAIYGTLSVTNCTFIDNYSPQGGGAIWINSLDSPATFTNNIFWDNQPNAIAVNTSSYNLSYCSMQTPEGDATNIAGDPLFVNPDTSDYTLMPTSPCIDMGTPDATSLNLPLLDLAGLPRIVDGNSNGTERIDMGCYEWQLPVANTDQGLIPNAFALMNQPNPFSMQTKISFSMNKAGQVKLEIYNSKGQKVKTLMTGNAKAGEHSVCWNGTDEHGQHVAKGIYLYRLTSDKLILNKKLIKL